VSLPWGKSTGIPSPVGKVGKMGFAGIQRRFCSNFGTVGNIRLQHKSPATKLGCLEDFVAQGVGLGQFWSMASF